jgi:CDP-glycerol glycerophosphotransferase (TagB/SpsB family)
MAADLYLGDVSSQVAEFLIRPRPCIFLNAHHAHWQNNKDYRFWTLGQVIDSPDELGKALSLAFTRQDEFEGRQRAYVAETFEHQDKSPTSPGAADAIMRFLQKKA